MEDKIIQKIEELVTKQKDLINKEIKLVKEKIKLEKELIKLEKELKSNEDTIEKIEFQPIINMAICILISILAAIVNMVVDIKLQNVLLDAIRNFFSFLKLIVLVMPTYTILRYVVFYSKKRIINELLEKNEYLKVKISLANQKMKKLDEEINLNHGLQNECSNFLFSLKNDFSKVKPKEYQEISKYYENLAEERPKIKKRNN